MTTTQQQKGTTPYRVSESLCQVKGTTCKEPHIVCSDRKWTSVYLEVRVKGDLLQMGTKEFSGMMEIFFLYLGYSGDYMVIYICQNSSKWIL